ncbi:5-carboxymethyl-2-hydroxymuconate semialdehyde dehydrogenase [Schinkia azotoformans MEV2011]|uniref:5-carboxymethyl-2-hydroxymuconate semialdehyde dehydrogenase n=2 Tax=Schinkia azotoformans TaxID=1454 RepID=K6CTK4_SCHAZ|nr:5-carboxymethyl-2-hydroxymuconate semialdehyde dehydrogenase [Schinkia azotoformans]EKN63562.1 5-carboxymethyl-2-hydroxymuconate semialdehyde dehydrogenase [Schinkia azotoformans LMG 9581]KEF37507.1 5-carboxymethyl-2-hydroxymuconate semialdehyde dehydrogenase [Schinkia azotoformans MEV2011]MEC1638862.1 5-carboxymethyl-2-hydroxymuconate semialdehyde dehydrogenase [Schinkia azotoformans]MEC1697830.1 5-carboxymethyl-2-hydroxymuconate semialdehyde dehydrogenase [Schinkia azotoformans]MEC1715985
MQSQAVETNNLKTHKELEDIKLYINGEFVDAEAGSTFANHNPFTNTVINNIAEGRKEDMEKAVAAANAAFENWANLKLKERVKYIYRIADLIDEANDEIAYLESLDTGLPISQTRNQAARAAENFRFYARMVETKHGESFPVDDEFINYTVYKPLGVVGLITPWNAPFMLETWKVAPALSTGNTVVLKPAELSPLTANKLAEIIDKAGLPKGVFNIVHGFGETAGDALVKHPDVKAISFTGETTTGSTIIRNSADTLKKTSMELGGKSPLIVFEDADLDRALDAAVWGIFSFNGERCTSNSRVFLHKNIKDQFVAALKERVRNIKIGDPMDPSTQLGPLIEKGHYNKVKSYIEIAKEEGCDVVQGTVPEEVKAGNFVPPTILLNATNDMRVAQEEIFGPVMAVIEFEDDEEVIKAANDVKYGLAGFVWTNNLKRAHRVANAVEAGMVWINAQNVRDLRIPFGGVKDSGIGREGGHYAFEFYTEPKVIHVAIGDHHIPQFGK